MNKSILSFGAIMLSAALAGSAWAGATTNTLVDANDTGIIDNATAKTKVKNKGCAIQAQIQTVNLNDGDLVVCQAEASVNIEGVGSLGGNSLLTVGVVGKGKLKIKADSSETGCGSTGPIIAYNTGMRCYPVTAAWLADGGSATGPYTAGTWQAQCVSQGGLVVGNTAVEPTYIKKFEPQTLVVPGACQILADPLGRLTPQGGDVAVFAQTGSYQPLE